MMIKEALTRFFFYGIFIAGCAYCASFIDKTIPSETAAHILIGFSFFFSITQAFNLLIIRNASDIRKIDNLGFWAKWRLDPKLEQRQKIARSRIITGLFVAVSLSMIGIYLKFSEADYLSKYFLGISTGLILISIYIAFIAIFDFFNLHQFDAEFSSELKKAERIKKALEDINKKDT